VATHTVTQPAANASSTRVKSESGFWGWLLGRGDAAGADPITDTGQPDAETAARESAHPEPAYRAHEHNPDRVALNMIGLAALAIRDQWSSTRFEHELSEHLAELRKRAAAELAAGQALLHRHDNAAQAPGRVAEVIEAAVKVEAFTGVPTSLDPQALGAGITALTANAHEVQDPTMQFPRPLYVDGMPDPRKVPAEVTQVPALPHPWDGFDSGIVRSDGSVPPAEVRPAIPHEQSPEAAPLPRRERHPASFQARLNPDLTPRDGHPAEALDIAKDAWLLHNGWWLRVSSADLDGDVMRVVFANGERDAPHFAATVHLLSATDAEALLAQAAAEVSA
jgi:hypothetical protein